MWTKFLAIPQILLCCILAAQLHQITTGKNFMILAIECIVMVILSLLSAVNQPIESKLTTSTTPTGTADLSQDDLIKLLHARARRDAANAAVAALTGVK